MNTPATGKTDPSRLHVSFLTSAPDLKRCPDESEPEIAFAGRSNAGKSSVLNRLTGNRQTARVSKTPGRTQLLNFFSVRNGGRLVDLPGYGYAKANRTAQNQWQHAVNHYLEGRPNLVGLVIVMDIRHPLQPLDAELVDWAARAGLALLLLLNKADKLSFGARQQTAQQVEKILRHRGLAKARAHILPFSALRGLNVDPVINLLSGWLAESRDQDTPIEPAEASPIGH